MPKLDQKLRVCKVFSLNTSSISDKIVRTVQQKRNSIGVCHDYQSEKHHNRINRVNETHLEKVREHIKSFKTIESHYCRKDPSKLHLPSDLSSSKTDFQYKQQYPDHLVSEYIYRHIFGRV